MKKKNLVSRIKSFFVRVWNYFPNKRREKLYQEIANWYVENVVKAREIHVSELKAERKFNASIKQEYVCNDCGEKFMDYPSKLTGSDVHTCDVCIFGHLLYIPNTNTTPVCKPVKGDGVFKVNFNVNTAIEGDYEITRIYDDNRLLKEIKVPIPKESE